MKRFEVSIVDPQSLAWLRTRFRAESHSQIVHDSLHNRDGWTVTYQLSVDSRVAGFASTAISGPWKDKPTIYELYLLPEYHTAAFAVFEAFLDFSGARFFEVQSNHALLTALLFRYATNIQSEAVVFYDHATTHLQQSEAVLESVTDAADMESAIHQRRGGGQWILKIRGNQVGSGGILFHYNVPYGDIHMEIDPAYRRQGYGAYLVQELKRQCYQLGSVPCARCNSTNTASQRTLQKAGFVPYAHILHGEVAIPHHG